MSDDISLSITQQPAIETSVLSAGETLSVSINGQPAVETAVIHAGDTIGLSVQPVGDRGPKGDTGPANSLAIGTVTTGAAGSSASATITGTAPNQTLSLTIPRGDVGATGSTGSVGATGATGPAGPANSLSIGTVSTVAAGESASATITGTAPNQTLNLTIPRGDKGTDGADVEFQASATHLQWRYVGGSTWTNLVPLSSITGPANSLSIGTTTTGAAGSAVSATITGTAPTQTLNLTIPRGDKGDTGAAVELQANSTHLQWRPVGGSSWTNLVALTAITGPAGAAAAVAVGTVTTGAAGSSATVTNSGTSSNVVLDFMIPRGESGTAGISWQQVPSSSASSGSLGDLAYDTSFLYVKTSGGWKRTALTSWTPTIGFTAAVFKMPTTSGDFASPSTWQTFSFSPHSQFELWVVGKASGSFSGSVIYKKFSFSGALVLRYWIADNGDGQWALVSSPFDDLMFIVQDYNSATVTRNLAGSWLNNSGNGMYWYLTPGQDYSLANAGIGGTKTVGGSDYSLAGALGPNGLDAPGPTNWSPGLNRIPALEFEGLLAAAALAGEKTVEDGNPDSPAFGSGGVFFNGSELKPGVGGGSANNMAPGGGAVVLRWDTPIASAPASPTSVVGSPGNNQVSLSWTAPSSNGGSQNAVYLVQYSSNNGSTWTTFNHRLSNDTSLIVTGLTNGTAYVFRVAAVIPGGVSPYSATSASVTPSA